MLYISSLLIFCGLLVMSAIFSGTETALTSIDDLTVHGLIDKKDPRGLILQKLLQKRGRIIAALLVGNTIVNTGLAVFATVVFDGFFKSSPLPRWLAPLAASLTAVFFVLVFGEVLPKNIAVVMFKKWSLVMARPVGVLVAILAPILKVLEWVNELCLKAFGDSARRHHNSSIESLLIMARMSANAGVIDKIEEKLIKRASIMNDAMARDVMVPRPDVYALDENLSVEEVCEVFRTEMYSRIPMYSENIDRVTGILHLKDIFRALSESGNQDFSLKKLAHLPLFIPETRQLGALLDDMKARREHMAIVIDEFGTTSGVVTLEDILEHLVGTIDDEHDQATVQATLKADGVVEATGRMTLDELETIFGVDLPQEVHEEVSTVAGLIMKISGEVPMAGAKVSGYGLHIKVLGIDGQKIDRVAMKKLPG